MDNQTPSLIEFKSFYDFYKRKFFVSSTFPKGEDSKLCAKKIPDLFRNIEAIMAEKHKPQVTKDISDAIYELLFFKISSILSWILNDQNLHFQAKLVDFPPPMKKPLIEKLSIKNENDEIPFHARSYFLVRFYFLMRLNFMNPLWDDFFSNGIKKIFQSLQKEPVESMIDNFLIFEYTFIYDLPKVAKTQYSDISITSKNNILEFSDRLLPVYTLYVESYIDLLRDMYNKSSRNVNFIRETTQMTIFAQNFECLFGSLVDITIRKNWFTFKEMTSFLVLFLSQAGTSDFSKVYGRQISTIFPKLLAKFLILAYNLRLYTIEDFTFFENVISFLGENRERETFEYVKKDENYPKSVHSIIIGIYLRSMFFGNYDLIRESYNKVSQVLKLEEIDSFEFLLKELKKKEDEDSKKKHEDLIEQSELKVTKEDWNYPFEIYGESWFLFYFMYYVAFFFDFVRRVKMIDSGNKPAIRIYKNGEHVKLVNDYVRDKGIPVTKLRKYAKYKYVVGVFIGLAVFYWCFLREI